MVNLSNQQKGSLLAFVGVMFITPDSLFIRLSSINTWELLFYRGAIPSVVILIALILFYKSNLIKVTLAMGLEGRKTRIEGYEPRKTRTEGLIEGT